MPVFIYDDKYSMTLKTSTHEKVVLKGIISELRRVCAKILCHAKILDYSEDDLFAIHLAMEEAIVNAVKHGNKKNTDKAVAIEYDVSPEKIDVTVTDQGRGFNPDGLDDPRLGDNVYKTGGRGVLLIKSYMDTVEYNEIGNSVHMVKLNRKYARQQV
jgi:serine/threonine-protein kinase RsbW